jgi:hypothetical protein
MSCLSEKERDIGEREEVVGINEQLEVEELQLD